MQVIPPPTTVELVRRFRQVHVLVIGDAMLDTYLEGDAARLCSEGPVPVVRKTLEQRIPGGAANVATNLRALEASVSFLSIVGRDITASLLRTALEERGIDTQWLVEDETEPTLHKLRILANGHYVVRFDEGGPQGSRTSPYTLTSQQQVLAHLERLYAACDVVLLSDYCYGVVTDELIERLKTLHAAHEKPILIDSKALQRFCDVPATIVTPNYQEARLLVHHLLAAHSEQPKPVTSGSAVDMAEVEHIAQQLLTLLATQHVAITLAEHGVFLLDHKGQAKHVPAHPVTHANDVGAGDSFASALALALAAGGTVEEAAQIGIDAAGIAVTKERTAIVQYQELLQRVGLRAYTSQAHTSQNTRDTLAQLVAHLEVERLLNHTIVFTNGVFDILHAGHVQFLRQAKALGDILVVAVNSDSSTRRLKGSNRPINGERDRLALVAALDMVDHVILFNDDTPNELIRTLRPHIHVKGGDYVDEVLPEAEAVREVGGQIVIVPLISSMSTSYVIDRILALSSEKTCTTSEGRHTEHMQRYQYEGHTQGGKV